MMDKREEAARALLAALPVNEFCYIGENEDLDETTIDGQCDLLKAVDAVIACIREPDEGMLNGARDWSVAKHGRGVGNDDATQCLQAMLDATRVDAPAESGEG